VALAARAGTQTVMGGDPPGTSVLLAHAIQESFVDAMHLGLCMAIAAAVIAAAVSASFIRQLRAPELDGRDR
jgi:hypothetical protein